MNNTHTKAPIFNLSDNKDDLVNEFYYRSLKELDEFFEIDSDFIKPKLLVIKNRKQMNRVFGNETPSWLVGWCKKGTTYILSRENFETESSHRYSDDRYYKLLKHEFCHLYYNKIAKTSKPYWLNEGLCIYISGQLKRKTKIKKFSNFLMYFDNSDKDIYRESGFFVELLVNKFGKEKLLKLISDMKSINTKEEFNILFEKTFKMKPSYDSFNKLI